MKCFCKGIPYFLKSPALVKNPPINAEDLREKLLKNSTLTILQSLGTCSKMERWKSSISGCLMSWLQIKKIVVLMCCLIFSSVQSLSHVWLFATPWTAAHTRLPCSSSTAGAYPNSCPMSWWCHPTISSSVVPFSSCLQSFPASGSFQMSQFYSIRWPKYWSFSFSISPSNEHPGLTSFRMDWLDLLAVQGTLKSLLQHHCSKASILRRSAFFRVQLSHPYMTTGKTIALTRRTFVGKIMSLLLNVLSRLVITFLPRSKRLLISWLQSPSAVILEPQKRVCHCLYCFPIYLPWSYGTGCLLLFLCNNEKPFLDQTVTCNEKWIVYDKLQQPAQWLDWEEAPKPFPKPNLHQKKVMATVWWSAADLILFSFLNPSKTITSDNYALQIFVMHWKLQYLQLSTERAQFFFMTIPDSTLHNQFFKSWMNWATKFCFICHTYMTSHQTTTTSSSILTTFFRQNISTTSRMQKMLSKRVKFQSMDLCSRNKQTYFSLAKMCWF